MDLVAAPPRPGPRRRCLAAALAALVASAAPTAASAQAASRLPRVGVLFLPAPSPDDSARGFGLGMRELGYVDGRNVVIEWRHAGGHTDRLASLAEELVQAKVDVIVAGGPGSLAAARRATQTIPIVTVSGSDPIAAGWARTLSQPGGNVTGLSVSFPELGPKRLELIKEALPALVRVAVVMAPVETSGQQGEMLRLMDNAARNLGLQLQPIEVREAADIERAVRQARDGRAQAIALVETSFVLAHRPRLVGLAAQERLPVIGEFTAFGVDGLLMAYGADLNDLLRRAATHVDRILKGARAGDLPVERPTRLLLTVNLKVARELGVTIPPSLRIQADRVLE